MILASVRALFRTLPLVLLSAMDIGVPFIRMLAFSHLLGLQELGLASLLAATSATYEQVTDIAVYRYVLSAPRAIFADALAAAHGLAASRGLLVGGTAIALAFPLAAVFTGGKDWASFAMLGAIMIVRGFEHLGPRIAERDYNYAVQLKVAVFAYSLSLAALAAALVIAPSHTALIASLLGQTVGQVAASHWLSKEPYRLRVRSPQFMSALRFALPLLAGGIGVAVSGQADRFLVGGMLGLPTLAIYSVLLLAAIVPISMVNRILNTVTVAVLINGAEKSDEILHARLKLAGRFVPLLAGAYAIGVATLLNLVVPLVFGPKFVASRLMVAALAISVFVRIVRAEPGNSILLYRGRTKRLALTNLVALSSVGFVYVFLAFWANIEAAVAGRIASDLLALIAMLYLIRRTYGPALQDSVLNLLGVACVVVFVAALVMETSVGSALGPSLAVLAAYFVAAGVWLAVFTPRLLREGAFRAIR